MAVSAVAQRTQYPLGAYNFRVSLAGATLSVAEVSGLAIEYETTTYRHGLSFVEGEAIVRHRIDKYVPLTLKKGVIQGVEALRRWFVAGDVRTLDISLCDERGLPVVTWHVGKAIPVKLDGPALSASSNEAALETLELRVARLTLEHH
jgi:phage tail-like protein